MKTWKIYAMVMILFVGLSALNGFLLLTGTSSDTLITYNWYNIFFFTLITLLTSSLGVIGMGTKSNQTFMLTLVTIFMLKLLFAAGFVLVLHYTMSLRPKLFFLPFAVCYILFTISETYILVKQNSANRAG